jgi:hypothetical protein
MSLETKIDVFLAEMCGKDHKKKKEIKEANDQAHINATKEIVQAERFLMTAKQAPSDPAMKQELNKALKHLQAAIVFLR